VFFSGDLAFSGRDAELSLAKDFVQCLTEAAEVPLDRCFFVPGNHFFVVGRISFELNGRKNASPQKREIPK
jgi:hypothetical protein